MFNEISFTRLHVFCKVVECKGFRAASDQLNISQPSISNHIKALEIELKMTLIERGRVIRVTEAGELLYDFASQTLRNADKFTRDISELQNAKAGRIAIAAGRSLVRSVLPAIFSRFKDENPGVDLILKSGRPDQIRQMVINREVDFGFIVGDVSMYEISTRSLIKNEVVFVACPNHPLVLKGTVTPEELSDYPFVVPSEESVQSRLFKDFLTAHGITVKKILMVVEDHESIKRIVGSSLGLAVQLKFGVSDELRNGKLAKINLSSPPFFEDICLVHRTDKYISPMLYKFINNLIKEIKDATSAVL